MDTHDITELPAEVKRRPVRVGEMLAALQAIAAELRARFESRDTRLQALEARIAALEGMILVAVTEKGVNSIHTPGARG
jgi:serine/threonine protein kinase HipA of HipAB toxin-antitoxin module